MDTTESQIASLWIEKHASQTDEADKQAALSRLNYTLPIETQKIISAYCLKEQVDWVNLLTVAYTLLMHRLSTADHIQLFELKGQVSEDGINLVSPRRLIVSTIDNEMTVHETVKKLESSPYKKNKNGPSSRYGIVHLSNESNKKNNKSSKEIDASLLLAHQDSVDSPLILLYRAHSFSKESIAFIADHLEVLLIAICSAKMTDKVISLNILTPNEAENILHHWRSPYSKAYPARDILPCVHEAIRLHARKNPDHNAVRHHDNYLTYGSLNTASDCLATHLVERGINVGDPVCVFMDRSLDLVIVMLAIFKVGAIFVPINPKYPIDRIEFVLNDTNTRYILTNINSHLPGMFQHLAWNITPNLFKQARENIQLPEANSERQAYIIYTSGTTGKPKGVLISHASLNNLSTWYQYYFKMNSKDIASQFASQGFDTYFCETIPTLTLGACIAIVDDVIKLTPDLFFDWIKLNAITICDIPTAYAQFLFTLEWPKQTSLKFIKFGGEAITHIPTTLFDFDLYNIYGPTESTVETTFFKLYDAKKKMYHITPGHPASIGKPLAHTSIYILDKHFMPTPVGIAGELYIGGASLSTGYFNHLDLTEKKFIHNPFISDKREKLYCTGDLAKWLPDGNIEFVGRVDSQVKVRGYRVELNDIENAIGSHPDVSEVLVLAKQTINGDKTLIAYVVPNLDRERYLYQERCLLTDDDLNFIEGITDDISKHGVAISGIHENLVIGKKVKIHLKLPGFNETQILDARVIWQKENRAGFMFEPKEETLKLLAKSIEYFLSNHNVLELILNAAAKRSLKRALQTELPDYMIPTTVVNLIEFPLTLNGKIDIASLPQPDNYAKTLEKKFVSAKTPTEIKLMHFWEEILNKSPISMMDNFFDIGGSSLTAAQLSVKIYQNFQISIPANILFELAYIPILAEYIDNNGKHYKSETDIQISINQDKILPESFRPTQNLPRNTTPPENILLTGAGGFLGVYLLRDLLKHTTAKIHCLVRQGDFETAAKRLTTTASKFNLDNEVNLSERRIIAVSGDLSFDHFGLPKKQYEALSDKVDLIIHCGAQVNIMASYQKLRGSNVLGTLEVLKFAMTSQDKPIHYISTLSSAYLKNAAGALCEDFPSSTYQDIFGGYAITKWVSEVLLKQAADRGLPVTIYRSGYIFGDSTAGILSLNDALLMLIKGCIQLGYAPDMNERITLLPVDFVSRAINAIALTQGQHSDVFHIDHPTGIMWPDLIHWINQQGYDIRLIRIADWKKKINTITQDNAIYPLLPFYLSLPDDYQYTEVSTDKARQRLNMLHLSYPEIDDALLKLYLNYLQEVGFLPIPEMES